MTEVNQKATIYQGEIEEAKTQTMYQDKEEGQKKKIITGILVLLILLIGARLINSFIWWGCSYLELKKYGDKHAQLQIFPVLQSAETARQEIQNIALRTRRDIVIGLLFDLRYKNRLLVYQKNQSNSLIKTGILMNSAFKGINDLRIYNTDIVEMRHAGRIGARAFGGGLLFSLYQKLAKAFEDSGTGGDDRRRLRFSYTYPPVTSSKYYQLPYLVYFFLPLILILILAGNHGRVILLSAVFYLEMLLLFNIKTIFFTGPFYWVFALFGVQELKILTATVIGLFTLVMLLLIFSGIRNISRKNLSHRAILIILFFIFLPLLLRI